MHRSLRACLSLLVFVAIAGMACAQSAPDFSGQWKQDNDRSQPKRSGDVTLTIKQSGAELTVETTSSHGSAKTQHAVQRYTTDGKVSTSIGADGDTFNTSVVWKDSSLVFSIVEQEDGRTLYSMETWSVIESGATLEKIRERPNGEKQTLIFRRMQ